MFSKQTKSFSFRSHLQTTNKKIVKIEAIWIFWLDIKKKEKNRFSSGSEILSEKKIHLCAGVQKLIKIKESYNFWQFSVLKPPFTRKIQKVMFGRTKLNSDLFSWGRAHSFLCCVQTGNRASNYRLAMRICDFFRW